MNTDQEEIENLRRELAREKQRRVESELAANELVEELNLIVEELTRSNDEMERFVQIASHDLQEPLRKIITFGERLKTSIYDQLDAQGRRYLDSMITSSGRMRHLVYGLLQYSRITGQRMPFSSINLRELIDNIKDDFAIYLEQTGGNISIDALPSLDGDHYQLYQLFFQLIDNSLKFRHRQRPPHIRISSRQADGMCHITVRDNGIGFEEKYCERIFGIFQRLHPAGSYEGTGIGLALCRKIVYRHKGSITASGIPEQGATFEIALPIDM